MRIPGTSIEIDRHGLVLGPDVFFYCWLLNRDQRYWGYRWDPIVRTHSLGWGAGEIRWSLKP